MCSEYIEIPVGPQHPALKEPIRFVFKIDGELVVDVEPRLGYAHRGIEKLAESKNYIQNIYLFERVCGICSAAHTTCYVEAVEKLLEIEVPLRGLFLRTIIHELNRIHSHLLWLGILAHEIGFDTLFMYTWRDRELVLDLIELMTGNRVLYAYNLIGGVRYDIDAHIETQMRKVLNYLYERTKYYKKIIEEDKLIRARTVNVGILKKSDAILLGAVGPTARGSGVNMDIRKDDPYSAYEELSFNIIVYKEEDAYAKTMVRVDEILESINIIKDALNKMPSGPVYKRAPLKVPEGEVISRVEAPRGELLYYIKSNGTERPERVKVRTPTLANIPAVCKMLRQAYIADIPVIVASIDPCIACMDRVMFIDVNKGKTYVLSGRELREYAMKWYEKKSER